jgi:hypothetical protein
LTGNTAPSLRVTRIRAHRVVTIDRLAGTAIIPSTQGAIDTIPVTCDLDTPAAAFVGENDADYFGGKNIELMPGERVTIMARFIARKATYGWELEVSYVDGQATHLENTPLRGFRLA